MNEPVRRTGSGLEFYEVDGKHKALVDLETHVVTSKKQRDAYRRKKELEELGIQGRTRSFVLCFHDPIRALMGRLTLDEMGALIKLLPYLKYGEAGDLVHQGKRMDKAAIGKAIGKKQRQTAAILSKLTKEGALIAKKEGRKSVYAVAKEIHTMGEAGGNMFTKLFQTYAKKQLEKLTTQQAGVLYALLPFFHYRDYILAVNPNETDDDLIEPMNIEEVGKMLGISKASAYRHIGALTREGIMLETRAYGVSTFYVNPDFMFRATRGNEFT
ncbi:hypothetical protein [Paludifilum halophilum]|uniref:Uncharacterized protein n=1 Tax=Paludifilum halophilum TaxID=1642702 RepID=A0A235B3S6_9BACL|nr:hypothetical protein [Paludifilum halophilum]OYD06285.1 hypothetical protein CHM34_17120 [Paludifilum halophilum]